MALPGNGHAEGQAEVIAVSRLAALLLKRTVCWVLNSLLKPFVPGRWPGASGPIDLISS